MKNGYKGIDQFRIAAAVLVIAIHTSPLLTYSETADFVLTRIIARAAVPFFFMTTGFFLFRRGQVSAEKMILFVKKTAVLYGISMILYLPLNVYSGYFKEKDLAVRIVKDVLVEGTFYHLWYLPASILGAVVAGMMLQKVGMKSGLVIASVLYVFGLLGDSYYGVTSQIPVLNELYEMYFRAFEYTRNGIFFAPLFLILGAWCSSVKTYPAKTYGIPFTVAFVGLLGEGLLLHFFKLQKHDSMYLMLPVCMFFLFKMLNSVRGERNKRLGTISMIVYVIHPFVIVLVRGIAKCVNLEEIFIKNSVGQFAAVTIGSIVTAVVLERMKTVIRKERIYHAGMDRD